MLRSMFSGVSGMKAHQTKLDVIGNNIANVNTYGFKSSRTTFSEVFYQTVRSASGASATQGGVNASQIGYGVNVATIDVMHTRSGFQMTDNGMDVAISGEGFFQVQNSDGSMFFTRAGMIRIDANGNLVDQNGNFVLGVSGDPLGIPAASDRIQITVPATMAIQSSTTEFINGKSFTLEAQNPTKDGNIAFNFASSERLPLGQKLIAQISSSGINIVLNKNEMFASLTELNNQINLAIKEAYGGREHPAGAFTIRLNEGEIGWPLSGQTIASTDYSPTLGNVALPDAFKALGFDFVKVSNSFSGAGVSSALVSFDTVRNVYEVTLDIGGREYHGVIPLSAGPSEMKLGTEPDTIYLRQPGFAELENKRADASFASSFGTAYIASDLSVASEASKALGFGSKAFSLRDGTLGGNQTVSDLLNIGIGSDGVISAIHSQLGLINVGRIDLATFANPQGLTQSGNTYFSLSANSGGAKIVNAGFEGAGALQAGALEMSNVDLSKEFADMITTQRGFQASSRLITVSDEILNELVNLKR